MDAHTPLDARSHDAARGAAVTPGGIDVSVVIPIFNSRDCLPALLRRIDDELDRLGVRHETILVDDDSTDGSWELVRSEATGRPHLTALRLMRNVGQISATLCGMQTARGEIVVTLDDDLQHPPDQIGLLLSPLAEDPELDAVFGSFADKRHRGYRNLASRIIGNLHSRAAGIPAGLRPSSFRAMRRRLARAVGEAAGRSPSLNSLICSMTRRLRSVEVRHDERFAGRSNYTLLRQLRLAFDVLASSSTLPLRFVSILGLIVCAASLSYGALVLYWYLGRRIDVPGWTTLALLASFSAGAVLLALGVFGEYLARILVEVRAAPRHVERERIGARRDEAGGGP
jgi:dolichol-phosphate mannosyltransferase/undecaprenyl-phosphate 4-deoxy-4-formamido-L-arabinose transferase